ncbi:MAG TPA: DUF1501 domain-containing protein [Nitrospira sp.]|nr:DUF1501 domain-containing protein [Nitrospira sp.]
MTTWSIHRRTFLEAAMALPLLWLRPGWSSPLRAADTSDFSERSHKRERILLLVELQGGNDGLNTVIPYDDVAYYRARPQLAIPRDQVRQLTPKLGLHPALSPLMPLWERKELAWLQGVGYPKPNRSHFRSIEIWDTASDSEEVRDKGWLSGLFAQYPLPAGFTAEGVLLGKGDAGPLSGGTTRTMALHDPAQLFRQAGALKPLSASTTNRALAHILEVRREISQAAIDVQQRVQEAPPFAMDFPTHKFGKQLEVAARLIAAKLPVAVIKVTHGSFDTHAGQLSTHHRLLEELTQGLMAFRAAMEQRGLWSQVLVMTYSEFGRRVGENASHGTDHGTAAPHLFMGGRVRGGLYGAPCSLTDLEGGDLKYTLDYRSLYATVIEQWWGLPAVSFGGGRYPVVDCLT